MFTHCAVLLAVIICLGVSSLTQASQGAVLRIGGDPETLLPSRKGFEASKRQLRSRHTNMREVGNMNDEERGLEEFKNALSRFAHKDNPDSWLETGRSPEYVFEKMKLDQVDKIEESSKFIPWLLYANKVREREMDATKLQLVDEEIFYLLRRSPTWIDDIIRSVSQVSDLKFQN
ncbi:unnamed protein product [Phytophthora fragariaefolia]|uniref:RxLR effector protein n=1 Tax=Phytophthora fragariaefolia TaxID=1490495 RepID=A0A9W6YE43_9STRA|nr:unnamed protein product [Phytophthora fragariaefolia]